MYITDRKQLYTSTRYVESSLLKKTWTTMFMEDVEKHLAGVKVMSSPEITRANEWKLPYFVCGISIWNRVNNQKLFIKAYAFSELTQANDFMEACESHVCGDFVLVATVVGRNRPDEGNVNKRNRARN